MAEEQLKSQGFSVINPARVNAALPKIRQHMRNI